MKKWRGIRIVSMLLVAVLLLSEIRVSAFAEEVLIDDEAFETDDMVLEDSVTEDELLWEETLEDDISAEEPDDFFEEKISEDETEDFLTEEIVTDEETSEEEVKDIDDPEELYVWDETNEEDEEVEIQSNHAEAGFDTSETISIDFVIPYDISNAQENLDFKSRYDNSTTNEKFVLKPVSRAGYDFDGWCDYTLYNKTGKIKKITYIPKNAQKKYVLQALFKPKTYKITYVLNATSYPVKNIKNPNPATYKHFNSNVDRVYLKEASATGYKFLGWYPNSNLKASEKRTYINEHDEMGDKTFYGKWEPIEYTVYFKSNDGNDESASIRQSYDPSGTEMHDGLHFTKSKEGYHVSGWYKDAKCKKGNYKPGSKVNPLCTTDGGEVTLYAKWAPNTYTVKYDGNGADKGKVSNTKATHGKSVKIAKNSFVKYGYVFEGWSLEKNPTTAGVPTLISYTKPGAKIDNLDATIDYENGGTVTYYAQWRPVKYTVKFKSSKSPKGETMAPIEGCEVGTKFTLPANTFTRKDKAEGIVFAGWRTTTKFGGKYLEFKDKEKISIPVTATKDGKVVTLQPIWKYDLIFKDSSGDEITTYAEYKGIEADKKFKLPKYAGTRLGYSFAGWSEKQNGVYVGPTPKIYKAGSSVKNLGNMTMITTWKPVTYTIKTTWASGSVKSSKMNMDSGMFTFPSSANKTVGGKKLKSWEIYKASENKWVSKNIGDEITAKQLIKAYADSKKTIKVRAVLEDIKFKNTLAINNNRMTVGVGAVIDLNSELTVDVSNYSDVKWTSSNKKVISNDNPQKPYVFTAKKAGKTKLNVKLGSKTISLNITVED